MQGKFFDTFLSRNLNPYEGLGQNQHRLARKKSLLKELLHAGFGGKNHLDSRGHASWNRKGRW